MNSSTNPEPTNAEVLTTVNEVLTTVNEFATNVEERFDKLESDVGTLKSDVGTLKSDMKSVKASMVTKDYLDEKTSDLRGDLTLLMRKEDGKVKAVVEKLFEKNIFSQEEKDKILSMEPFPQLAL